MVSAVTPMNDFLQRTDRIADVEVRVQSYRVGQRWAAKVESADAGNVIGRAMDDTREAAERAALDGAKTVIELRNATASLRASTDKLRDKK